MGSLTLLALPRCAMTDDYFVDPELASSGGAAGGGGRAKGGHSSLTGGVGGTSGGASGSSAGFSSAGGGTTSAGGSSAGGGSETGGSGAASGSGGASPAAGGAPSFGGTVVSTGGGNALGGSSSGGTNPGTGGRDGASAGENSGGEAAGGGGGEAAGGVGAGGDPSSAGAGGDAGNAGAGGSGTRTCDRSNCSGTCCGNECVDLTSDEQHCGSCTTACSVGRSCVDRACSRGWTPTAAPPASFPAREKAAYAAFGQRIFVFGGLAPDGTALNDGAIYDARTDSWQLIGTDAQTPSPRQLATAVWTGTAMLVFGGRSQNGTASYRDGALYDPASDKWTRIANNLTARVAPVAAAAGTQAVFWGGWTAGLAALDRADRYTLTTDTWDPAAAQNDPDALADCAWAFSGAALYVYGGRDENNNINPESDRAYRYTLATNSWATLTRGPSARWGAFGAWDGTNFVVWGGRNGVSARNDGQLFGAQWTAMSNIGAPSARWASFRESGWSFTLASGSVAFLGGLDSNGNALHNGGRFERTPARWTPISSWPSGEAHAFGVAAWTGAELVIWGGRDGVSPTATGERWAF